MFGEKIINKIEKGMYNIEKEKAKKLLFGDTSTIVENENNITCYIKRNRIKKIGQDYIIRCNGIGNEERSFAKEFNLDKPVYYVLEGLEFIDGAVQIYGYNNPHVLIDNCNFDLGAHIYVLGCLQSLRYKYYRRYCFFFPPLRLCSLFYLIHDFYLKFFNFN